MIKAKVICDSVAHDGTRLTTMEVEYGRMIHSEFMTHRMLCLAGDAELYFDLSKKNNSSKIYKMKIKDFVNKWHNGVKKHKSSRKLDYDTSSLEDFKIYSAKEAATLVGMASPVGIRNACRRGEIITENPTKTKMEDHKVTGLNLKKWLDSESLRSFDIRGRMKGMQLRQLNEDTGLIQHTTVVDCFVSGVKETFEVKAGKFKVSGSKDHKILTSDGWKTIENLVVGVDEVIIQKLGTAEDLRKNPIRHKKIGDKWVTKFNKDVKADLVGSQDGDCWLCKEPLTGTVDVHHLQEVYKAPELAFDRDNVVAVHPTCHKKLHAEQGWQVGNYLYGKPEKVESITSNGEEDTYDLEVSSEYENFIANGIVVHNSRNAASSRAIPFDKMLKQLEGIPSRFGAANKGMQDAGEITTPIKQAVWNDMFEEYDILEYTPVEAWQLACNSTKRWAEAFKEAGYHKQIYNRLTEPFQMIKVVVSATEWDNFFWLRDDEMADPTIAELAKKMKEAMDASTPKLLNPGEWHLPYVDDAEKQVFTTEEAIKVSCARCAAVSFRNTDYTLAKSLEVYDRLVGSDKKHSSALEHCATPMNTKRFEWDYDFAMGDDMENCPNDPDTWQDGVSHADRYGNLWSGNFKRWIQYRKLLKGENYTNGTESY